MGEVIPSWNGDGVFTGREPHTFRLVMSKFSHWITAANAASAAASAYELRKQQEEYAEEAWEREEARKEREEERQLAKVPRQDERSAEKKRKQAETDETKEREKRWDYETEGIRGGIEAILKYRDPRFRLKLLEWHKEGQLRTDEEIEMINSLMKDIGDSIVTEELEKILSGRYDGDWVAGYLENDNDRAIAARSARLDSLLFVDVIRSGYCSVGVKARLAEVCGQYRDTKECLEEKEREWRLKREQAKNEKLRKDALNREKKEQESMLKARIQEEENALNLLAESRKWPERVVGGVISWVWRYSSSNTKWTIRVICVLVAPGLWPIMIPGYLVLWLYVSLKSNGDIRSQKRALRKAKAALEASH